MRSLTLCLLVISILGVTTAPTIGALALAAGKEQLAPTEGSATELQQQDEQWRYRHHNGHWWYWLPSNKWVYWTGGRWAPFEKQSNADHQTVRRPQSYSYPADQGNWGPVRYDRFGNPQWPYSQRKSGLRQLGPVPAMGGVRSLPGWGGER